MQERPDNGRLEPDTNTQAEAIQEQSLEELFAEAEALIGRMEDPDISLEEAFAAYDKEVKAGTFPSKEHEYGISEEVIEKLY